MSLGIRKQFTRSSVAIAAALLVALALGLNTTAYARGGQQWFTAWGTSAHSLAPATTTVSDATVRMIVRSGITGNALRVKIENTLGIEPLQIDAASIALRDAGASLVPGSSRPLTFGGQEAIVIPIGEGVWSDEVVMRAGGRTRNRSLPERRIASFHATDRRDSESEQQAREFVNPL